MRLPRHPLLAGLLTAACFLSPLARAEEPAMPKLTDSEVLAQLRPAELTEWKKAVSGVEQVQRDLAWGKRLTTPPGTIMAGGEAKRVADEKVKGEALIAAANTRMVELEKNFETLRAKAAARLAANVITALCPVRPLPEALKSASLELVAASDKAGYDRLALAGVFLSQRGSLSSDPGLVTAFGEALTVAGAKSLSGPPSFVGSELKLETPGTAVAVAEVHPLANKTGAILSVRLVDGRSFRIVSASVAFIPSGLAQPTYGQSEGYEVAFSDRRNFLANLGQAREWSFGTEGDEAGDALLKAVLAGRGDTVVDGYDFLAKVLNGPKANKVSKAYWITSPAPVVVAAPGSDPNAPKNIAYEIKSRAAEKGSAPIPVGSLVLRPYVKPQQ